MLRLVNINKSYQIRKGKMQNVLNNLNVEFSSKGFVSILGNSGNGKTTLLNIIGGLDRQDSGEIYFNDQEISDYELFRREKVGFVFQDFNLIDHLSALDNVIISMSDENKNKKKNATEILTKLGLEDCLHKLPKQMSGGQKQRVAIARMIAKDVDVIICDEPTGSLDEETERNIVGIIKELSKEKLVLFVTHNRRVAEKYSDRIIRIKSGSVFEDINDYDKTASTKIENNKLYNENCLWLSIKNLIGRYKQTVKYIVLTAFIMLVASLAIIMESELFRLYMHDYYIDKGIMSIILDIKDDVVGEEDLLSDWETKSDIIHAAFNFDSTIKIGRTDYQVSGIYTPSRLEEITSNEYLKEMLTNGRLPKESNEVLMSAEGAISLLTKLNIGGERLYDQFMTGELDSEYVYSLMDDKEFIVAEYGTPRMKVVGLVDDNKVHETDLTVYFIDGFTSLFEYPKGLQPTKIKLYKDNLNRDVNDEIINIAEQNGQVEINEDHRKKVDKIYNKIDSFLELSKIALYVIIVIASISFFSLLSTSLFERKYEIGLYRSIGYNKRNINKILGSEMFFTGVVSLLLVIISLLAFAVVMYFKLDFIKSFVEVFNIINLFNIVAALVLVLSFFVSAIVYIVNRTILKNSILSNIKDL
ncbi:ABC transporter ATP-binding protein/permease [Alkaliphilus hydrothermalis]|uniref:ABC-type lipoprotein export system ATPase subunit n=1 Tax=Alkaliphilus hydrothermalis TaxID=1482730 RepID=A0ABS2NLV6_9FIRM|nr:ABC transporter ATP-binding protein/permease [Alkaliphilus hydrothermalis]MBM7613866.1 ABC-type lipoprotein export system ATPase subunit [Alkaliphilus hydrothermalis]